jgi:aldose 1-epimerase
MYSIQKTQFGPYDHYQIKDANDEESISVIPAFGGLLNDWSVNAKSSLLGLLQNYKDYKELEEKIDVNFQGPKLIPYPNRVEDGRYTFEGEDYELGKSKIGEPNSIHGFLCRLPMQVTDQRCHADHASITLHHSYDGNVKGYPFRFDLDLIYQLHATDGLTILTRIKNTGEGNMPFGDGWHPYFVGGNGISELELAFHATGKLEKRIPTINSKPCSLLD